MSRRAVQWAILGLIASLPFVEGAHAKEPPTWTQLFAAPDMGAAWSLIEDVRVQKRVDTAPALVTAVLESPHAPLVTAAGDALREIGVAYGPELAGPIELAVRAANLRRKAAAARLLAAWAPTEADALLTKLCATSSAGVEDALWLVGGMPVRAGPAQLAIEAAIVRALADVRPEVRCAGCVAAGRRKADALAPRLVDLVLDQDVAAGPYAVRALERIGRSKGARRFITALQTWKNPEALDVCRKAIVSLSTVDDVPDLLELSSGRDLDHVYAAVLALGRLARPSIDASGAPVLSIDTLPLDRQEEIARRLLVVAERTSERRTRAAVVRALSAGGRWSAPWIYATALRWMDTPDPKLRTAGARLAAGAGLATLRDRLVTAACEDDDSGVRAVAARGLDLLGAKASADALLRVAGATTRPDVRRRAAIALGYLRDESVVGRLIDLLERSTVEPEAVPVLAGLERLTGHALGRDVATWKAWASTTKAPLKQPMPRLERSKLRRTVVESHAFSVSPDTEAAMERGLGWLAGVQRTDGSWSSREDGWGGSVKQAPTYTGLCLSTFAGAGYAPSTGRYRETVWRAAEYLASTQRYDGRTPSYVLDRVFGYGTERIGGIAAFTLAACAGGLLDAYVAAGDREWLAPTQRTIDFYADHQEPESGWGRDGVEDPSTSITALAVMVLAPAVAEGLAVDPWALDGADALLWATSSAPASTERLSDVIADPSATAGPNRSPPVFFVGAPAQKTGRPTMNVPSVTLTEPGLMGRVLLGWPRSHPSELGAAAYLIDTVPTAMEVSPQNRATWIHARAWTGALAMFQMGGRHWRVWSDAIARIYPAAQVLEPAELYGSFESDVTGNDQGRLFATAVSTMTLQTAYRFPFRPAR